MIGSTNAQGSLNPEESADLAARGRLRSLSVYIPRPCRIRALPSPMIRPSSRLETCSSAGAALAPTSRTWTPISAGSRRKASRLEAAAKTFGCRIPRPFFFESASGHGDKLSQAGIAQLKKVRVQDRKRNRKKVRVPPLRLISLRQSTPCHKRPCPALPTQELQVIRTHPFVITLSRRCGTS